MLERILVPLEGSEVSESILPYVKHLAIGMHSPVILVSVVDPDDPHLHEMVRSIDDDGEEHYGPGVGGVGMEDVTYQERPPGGPAHHETSQIYGTQVFENIKTDVDHYLRRIAHDLQESDIECEWYVRIGQPSQEILGQAEESRCGMIAMSTHARHRLTRAVIGSVADAVIRTSHVPVLTLSAEHARRFEGAVDLTTALVGLDGSELSEAALPYVAELGEKLGLAVHLVRIVDVSPGSFTGRFMVNPERLRDRMERDAKAYLENIEQGLRQRVLNVQSEVVVGNVTSSMLHLLEQKDYDIVIAATHGRTGLARWALGSLTESLIRESGDPILVVPPTTSED